VAVDLRATVPPASRNKGPSGLKAVLSTRLFLSVRQPLDGEGMAVKRHKKRKSSVDGSFLRFLRLFAAKGSAA
jgi:hypothetical protein